MRFDLTAMARRKKNPRRPSIPIRSFAPTSAQVADLAATYLRTVRTAASAAKERILPAYERSLARRTTDGLVTDDVSEVQGAVDDLLDTLTRLAIEITPELRRWAVRYETYHRAKWAAGVLTATTVDLGTMIGAQDVAETIGAFLARNVALVRDVSAQVQARIADAVFRGYQQRTPVREVAKAINEAVQMSRRRAERIAADQSTKLSSALDAERQRQAGLDTWEWKWSHKLHGRPEHIARDGNIYTDANAPKDLPGMLPFCGCRRAARLVFAD